jgi:hypothetical protein
VLRRFLLFAAYALIGAVLSYGLVYLFSPLGLVVVVVGALLVSVLPRGLEAIGLLAGPGLLLLAGDGTLVVPGAAIIAASLAAYVVTGRARCAT